MQHFALGIAYGMGTASLCWVVGYVARAIFRVFRSV